MVRRAIGSVAVGAGRHSCLESENLRHVAARNRDQSDILKCSSRYSHAPVQPIHRDSLQGNASDDDYQRLRAGSSRLLR